MLHDKPLKHLPLSAEHRRHYNKSWGSNTVVGQQQFYTANVNFSEHTNKHVEKAIIKSMPMTNNKQGKQCKLIGITLKSTVTCEMLTMMIRQEIMP